MMTGGFGPSFKLIPIVGSLVSASPGAVCLLILVPPTCDPCQASRLLRN